MAFTYELNGDSYLSVADADTYHSDRNRLEWANLTADEKEASLRRATTFLDSAYDWKGELNDTDNAHAWPRDDVEDDEQRDIDNTTLPDRIKDATAELAFIDALKSELLPVDKGGETQRVKAGSVEIEYAGGQGTGMSLARVKRLVSGLAQNVSGKVVTRT